MALTLYYHPLASYCHKVLLALYENETEFHGRIIDFGDPASSAELSSAWPIGKIPLLKDELRDSTIPETSIIIEYLDRHYPGPMELIPKDAELNLQVRLWDRFYDLYVSTPMQKIVADELRPAGQTDPFGVAEARSTLDTAYAMIEQQMADKTWAIGDAFSMADCAAAPALFYAEAVHPFSSKFEQVSAYFDRIAERRSFQSVIEGARPYFNSFPYRDAIPARFL